MTDYRRIVRATMVSLVNSLGCYDAVAETINARWGGVCCKGTISKKVTGLLEWTFIDVIAIEDALQRYPITRLMVRRLERLPSVSPGSLMQDGISIVKECGEAIAAVLAAEQSCCADQDAQAIAEVDEAIAAMRQVRAKLESRLEQAEGAA